MSKSGKLRERASRAVWLRAASNLLISGGIGAVKVMTLAKILNLTRTGFYWHFKDIGELHGAMIQAWESKNTGNLVDRCSAEASCVCESLFNLADCWFDPSLFDAGLDLAIRNWARNDAKLQERLRIADTSRIRAVTGIFERFGYSQEQAEVRGLAVIYTQIGYFSMQMAESNQDRLARVPHYIEMFAGVAPGDAHVVRFLQRHQILAGSPREGG